MSDEPDDQPAEEEPAEEEPADEEPAAADDEPAEDAGEPAGRPRRLSGTSLLVAGLLALLGFTFAIQVRSVAEDPTVAALDEEDLVRILANLDAHEERLQQEIGELQDTQRRLTTAGESQQEALAEAARRADELGILAGTLPAVGPGVVVTLRGGPAGISAATLLDAVQELRSAGAEAMQIDGAGGGSVRVVASSYLLDGEDGVVVVDGTPLRSPYTITAIGEAETLAPALRIPGGVVASVEEDGGTVTVQEEPAGVDVSTVREPAAPQYARPDS
jgi:uncharacterized protein YlxW (UPF0749 family)